MFTLALFYAYLNLVFQRHLNKYEWPFPTTSLWGRPALPSLTFWDSRSLARTHLGKWLSILCQKAAFKRAQNFDIKRLHLKSSKVLIKMKSYSWRKFWHQWAADKLMDKKKNLALEIAKPHKQVTETQVTTMPLGMYTGDWSLVCPFKL